MNIIKKKQLNLKYFVLAVKYCATNGVQVSTQLMYSLGSVSVFMV